MAAEVTLQLATGEQRMLVPLTAVLGDSDGNFVYVATAEGEAYRIERAAVQTGVLDNDGIEILQGLSSGQQVVVAGMSQISEGMAVTLYESVGE